MRECNDEEKTHYSERTGRTAWQHYVAQVLFGEEKLLFFSSFGTIKGYVTEKKMEREFKQETEREREREAARKERKSSLICPFIFPFALYGYDFLSSLSLSLSLQSLLLPLFTLWPFRLTLYHPDFLSTSLKAKSLRLVQRGKKTADETTSFFFLLHFICTWNPTILPLNRPLSLSFLLFFVIAIELPYQLGFKPSTVCRW